MPSQRQIRDLELSYKTLSLMRREKLSLREAAAKLSISPRVVLANVGDALRRIRGNYYAKPFDSAHRPFKFITEQGIVTVNVDSREATIVSKYMTAVKNYLDTGRESFLAPFRGKQIGSHRFVTDPRILDDLADAGELEFDKLYNFVFDVRR